MDDTLTIVAELLRKADRALFITGAGLSADSGLPTYRGVGGLYDRSDTEDGMPIEVALSGQMLTTRPDISWKYLWQIFAACRGAAANRGHEVIALIERAKPGTWVLTQNVDGLHRAAGSRQLIEIHGNASELRCEACGHCCGLEAFLPRDGSPPPCPPLCPGCNGPLRPNVVLFGEMLPETAVAQLYATLAAGPDLVFSVGTSSVFPYISQPVQAARADGVPTVEINPGQSDVSDVVDHRIEGGAAEVLDRLWTLASAEGADAAR